jgi:hypothetical protein
MGGLGHEVLPGMRLGSALGIQIRFLWNFRCCLSEPLLISADNHSGSLKEFCESTTNLEHCHQGTYRPVIGVTYMSLFASVRNKHSSWPISVGAEGIAAAQFARCGFDVLVQAGHDKPWYDFAVIKAGNLLKIAVKASEDGCWSLVHSYMKPSANMGAKKSDAHRAVDLWLDIHGSRTIYCLVQFEDVALNQLPRIYLASPIEIARRMRESVERLGDPILHEQYEWIAPDTGFGSFEALPSSWLFSHERIHELADRQPEQVTPGHEVRKSPLTVEFRSNASTSVRQDLRPVVMSA